MFCGSTILVLTPMTPNDTKYGLLAAVEGTVCVWCLYLP